jgi:hypothetical protein
LNQRGKGRVARRLKPQARLNLPRNAPQVPDGVLRTMLETLEMKPNAMKGWFHGFSPAKD